MSLMKAFLVTIISLIISVTCKGQNPDSLELYEEPGYYAPFFSKTIKEDSLWHRQLWYSEEGTLYMDGWYMDEQLKVPHGKFYWFYSNQNLKEQAEFVNGLREGITLMLNVEGYFTDSIFYSKGKRLGVGYKWHSNGIVADSGNFDGKGNGVIVSWDENGMLKSAGHYVSDTSKTGRWKHFHPNGVTSAIVDYDNGVLLKSNCFDAEGKVLNNCESFPPQFPGGAKAWLKAIQKNLNASVPYDNNAPAGRYTVIIEFVVEVDGSLTNFRATTNHGYGMEKEALRAIMKSGKWTPGREFGSIYRSTRRQPLTFIISY